MRINDREINYRIRLRTYPISTHI